MVDDFRVGHLADLPGNVMRRDHDGPATLKDEASLKVQQEAPGKPRRPKLSPQDAMKRWKEFGSHRSERPPEALITGQHQQVRPKAQERWEQLQVPPELAQVKPCAAPGRDWPINERELTKPSDRSLSAPSNNLAFGIQLLGKLEELSHVVRASICLAFGS
jgi:hypothetical protein